jgi:hypothetical protein
MGVLHDYVCAAHGKFEAREPKCPHGCSKRFVKIEFNTSAGIVGAKTKSTDGLLKNLANDFKLPDIANSKDGESVMAQLKKRKYKKDEQPATIFAEVPGTREARGWTQREGEAAPKYDVRRTGAKPGIALKEGSLPPVRPLVAKHHHYRADIPKDAL